MIFPPFWKMKLGLISATSAISKEKEKAGNKITMGVKKAYLLPIFFIGKIKFVFQ